MNVVDEQFVVKAVSEGDVNAFSKIFHAYHHQLGQYVFSVTRSADLSEEVVQDVFVKLWDHRRKLADVQSLKAYLFAIARNETLNAIRKLASENKKRQLLADQLQRDSQLEEEADFAADAERDRIFEHAVSRLPPQQQQVFLLRRQGMKNAQIAVQMNISPHSAKKYQQLALQAIEKFIKSKVVSISIICSFFMK